MSSGQFPVTTTPEVAAQLKASVRLAVDSLNCVFGSLPTRVVPDGQGGAWVELSDVALGPPFAQETSFLVFLLPFNLPGSDIYPMFVRSDLSRVDGNPLGAAFQSTQLAWPGDPAARPVVQVSRRTRGAFASQTAAQKVCKVLEWMRST
jgi:hypothetical protein